MFFIFRVDNILKEFCKNIEEDVLLTYAPVLLLANNHDTSGAITLDEITEKLAKEKINVSERDAGWFTL
jgi:hypothetical protein